MESIYKIILALIILPIVVIVVHTLLNGEAKKKEKELELYRESKRKNDEKAKAATEQVQSITAQHIKVLALKWDQTVSKDEYGNHLFDKWNQALDYFVDNVLLKDPLVHAHLLPPHILQTRIALNDPNFMEAELNELLHQVKKLIVDAVIEYKTNQLENEAHLSVDVDSLDPIQFEHFCADMLRNDGWNARVTQASGDQGIDVIAHLGDIKAVFQCKKYSQPVGNAAVQEIFAGKQHEQAHVAAVVSNASYTPSAKQLASTTGVHLLHFSELPQFAERLGLVET
jgi:restriction system protein